MDVLRCAGVETEAEVPFPSLDQLLAPALARAGHLPDVQAAALRGALGPAAGRDQLLVGVAVLTLLAELAEDRPVRCMIDDAHWLDRSSAQALRFAARRLHAESIAMIFGAADEFAPDGLPVPSCFELEDGELPPLPGLPEAQRRQPHPARPPGPHRVADLSRTERPGPGGDPAFLRGGRG